MHVDVSILGLPPKKDGANSMWGKTNELPRLKALRREVSRAIGNGIVPEGRVSITLVVYAEVADGDLDNFLTGICDGLMAAHQSVPTEHLNWSEEEPLIAPHRAIAFVDDRWVSRIVAERRPVDTSERRYDLSLEWLVP